MDYAVFYLHATFGTNREDMPTKRSETPEEWDNLNGFVWFVDGSEKKVYNVHDAGNFLWGYTMHLLGFGEGESLNYAQKNESGQDASADQAAIEEGL